MNNRYSPIAHFNNVPLYLQLVDLLKRVEFIIVPVANPDGYYVSLIK